MAMAAGKAVIDIYPSMKGFKSSVNSELKAVGAAGTKTGTHLKSALTGAFKAAAASAAAVTAVTVKIGKDAFQAYGQFEQLTGGVNKLFGESADAVMKNAQAAFKTAGMSANQYMDNVMKFSASLIQSLGGDTVKAAKIADTAIKDMSDNVNTFGSNIEDVQNAYQGFAKQNFTMLDNLRLGYGGTKTEMQRLLKDAEKISGVKYDISSFADITQAIHVMQEEMAIAGTTTREAATTIEGSVATMKAAWSNLLIAMGSGENVGQATQDLVDSVTTVIQNSVPVIKEIAKAIPKALGEAIREGLPEIKEAFSGLADDALGDFSGDLKNIAVLGGGAMLPLLEGLPLVGGAFAGISAPVAAVVTALGLMFANSEKLRTSFVTVFETLQPHVDNLLTSLQPLLDIIGQLAGQIGDVLGDAMVELAPVIGELMDSVTEAVEQMLPAAQEFLPKVGDLLKELVPYLIDIVKQLAPILGSVMRLQATVYSGLLPVIGNIIDATAPIREVVQWFVTTALSNLSTSITFIVDLITLLVGWVTTVYQTVSGKVAEISATLQGFGESVGSIFETIKNTITGAFENAYNGIVEFFTPIVSFFTGIADKIRGAFSNLGSSLGDAVGGALKTTVNSIIGYIEGKINSVIGAINSALGAINKIPGVSIGKLSTISLPRAARGGILTQATPLIAGEAGAEAILPLERNTGWIRQLAHDITQAQSTSAPVGRGGTVNQYNTFTNVNPAEVYMLIDKYMKRGMEVYL